MKKNLLKYFLFIVLCCSFVLGYNSSIYASNTEIWVNGIEVTQDNCENVMSGVSYDFDTNTLYLNNANLTTTHEREAHDAAISATGDINIVLTGTNNINVSGGTVFLDGIYANGTITISGSGSLNIQAEGSASETNAIATGYTEQTAGLIVNSGTIYAKGETRGLYLDKSYGSSLPPRIFEVNGGDITLIGSLMATTVAPDFDKYEGSVITAAWDEEGKKTDTYNESSLAYYKYLKINSLEYDDDGFAEGNHYQPAKLNDNNTPDTSDDYYEINNAGNLFWFSEYLSKDEANINTNAKLIKDITIPDGRIFDPISAGTYNSGYGGTFDGQGHTISNINIDPQIGFSSTGMFTMITESGEVKNLTLKDTTLNNSTSTTGTICGYNKGKIEKCSAINTVINSPLQMIGGICGENEGTINKCYNASDIKASSSAIGGICGVNSGTINNSYNTAAIEGGWYVGGIAGEMTSTGNITNSYNIGTITTMQGYETLGNGVAGNKVGTITNSYYLASSQTEDGGRTAEEFNSGEITYLLNEKQSSDNVIWRQTLHTKATNSYPTFDGKIVYAGYRYCYSTNIEYGNDKTILFDEVPNHDFSILKHDETSHWYACSTNGCTAVHNKENHIPVIIGKKDATCTSEGYTGDKVCKVCNFVIKKGSIIKKVDHSYKDGVCTMCGQSKQSIENNINTPNTKDNSNILVWIILSLISAMSIITLYFKFKKSYTK